MARIYTISLLILLTLTGCQSYFGKKDRLNYQIMLQNSRVIMLSSNTENQLKVFAKVTYLNDVDNISYNNREYFFLEIFNDDEDVILPDSMQISMFDKEPLWIRKIDDDELAYDDVMVRDNPLSTCYLLAFKRQPPRLQKNMKVKLAISGFSPNIFDFSYIVLNTKL